MRDGFGAAPDDQGMKLKRKQRFRVDVRGFGSIFGLLAGLTVVVLLAPLAMTAPAAADTANTSPSTVTIDYISPRTFSPNGDGYEDTTIIRFCLDSAANVTAT